MGGLTKFFYLGIAFLFAWIIVILILVRHYWWNWVTKICLKACGPLCCVRTKKNEAENEGTEGRRESRALPLEDSLVKLPTFWEEDEKDLSEVIS